LRKELNASKAREQKWLGDRSSTEKIYGKVLNETIENVQHSQIRLKADDPPQMAPRDGIELCK
jgi:hypothetical protein